jgi:hypothetical protein
LGGFWISFWKSQTRNLDFLDFQTEIQKHRVFGLGFPKGNPSKKICFGGVPGFPFGKSKTRNWDFLHFQKGIQKPRVFGFGFPGNPESQKIMLGFHLICLIVFTCLVQVRFLLQIFF